MARMNMPPGPGRPKGSKNKVSNDARQRILDVAAELEAEGRGMADWARENPTEFWGKLYRAVVPKEVDANVKGDVTINVVTGINRAPNE